MYNFPGLFHGFPAPSRLYKHCLYSPHLATFKEKRAVLLLKYQFVCQLHSWMTMYWHQSL